MEIHDFLEDCIAADELEARDAYRTPEELTRLQSELTTVIEGRSSWVATDPTRIFAECEAVRAVLRLHPSDGMHECPELYGSHSDSGLFPAACPTLKALARVYADRPGFQEEGR